MSLKGRQSIQIPGIRKPVQIIRTIFLPGNHNNNQSISHLVLSTIDKKLAMVQIDYKNRGSKIPFYTHYIKQVQQVVTAIWQQPKCGNLWLGHAHGNITVMKLQTQGQKRCLQIARYTQISPALQKSIMLLYLSNTNKNKQLVTFNIQHTINFHHPSTLALIKSYTFSKYCFTSAMTFLNPFNQHTVACVAFNAGTPPMIFECQSWQQCKQAFQQSLAFYKQAQQYESNDEVTCIADQTYLRNGQQTLITASIANQKENKNYIAVYQLKQHPKRKIFYLQIIFKFQVKNYVLYIDVKDGLAMVSMYSKVLFFDMAQMRRFRSLEKQDLGVTLGLILDTSEKQVVFIANKGFNYLCPQSYKESNLKFKLRSLDVGPSKIR